MSTAPSTQGEDSSSMVYRLMSQGMSAVVAKTLLRMESKCAEAMADMEKTWQAKLRDMATDAKAEIRALKTELEETKIALIDIRSECSLWKNLNQQKCASAEQAIEQIQDNCETKLRSMSSTVKVILERVVDHESVLASFQKNVDNFYHRYNDRNSTIDSLFLQTKTEIGDVFSALDVVDRNAKCLSHDVQVMKNVFYHNIDAVQSKLDEFMELNLSEKKACCEKHVSFDEHRQLRSDLEDQMLKFNMKIDHVLLTAQQQYEETKSRCDELKIISAISLLNKKRREKRFYSDEVQEKHRLPVFDVDRIQVDERSILHDVKENHAKLEDQNRNLIDDTSTVGLEESFVDEGNENGYLTHSVSGLMTTKGTIAHVEQYEFDDDDSLFGGSVNLVFLSEMNIQD